MIEFGSLICGKEEISGSWLDSYDPWTGEKLGRVAEATPEQIESALAIAEEAWENPPPLEERKAVVAQMAELVNEHRSWLVDLLIQETGKPKQFAIGEVERLERTFRLSTEITDELRDRPLDLSYDPRGEQFAGLWNRFPVGPILAFVPYNWPYNLAAHKLAPAMIAGCPILLKVSPLAPLCSFALGKLLIEAGAPKGFIAVMHISNENAQNALKHERIKMLSFTGSPRVGWMLKELAQKKKVLLELGGNAPVIVEADANLDLAAQRSAYSGYGYAGQVCISAQNVFVHRDVYNEFREKLIRYTEETVTGDPRKEDCVCGPLISEEAAKTIQEKIESAVKRGAKIIAQAKAEKHPRLLPPTLVENPPPDEPVFCEEIFGPVLTLNSYVELDSLIETLNRGRYRLQASLFTSNDSTADKAYRTLRYGALVCNESPSLRFDSMPYGGEGESGFGREGVRFALEEMTSPRTFLWRKK
ncbi:MAG TPA: aldehyde dehydrogenase family protein [Fimbriimonadales bacterium]|nr:aldehyde dehydrogenase family protein [Fimbriimonadales bacterium]